MRKDDTNNTIWLSSCHSTNTFAKHWVSEKGIEDGLVICTDNQISGRGQMGNTWESEPNKNLTFSIISLFPELSIKNIFFISIAVSLGIVDFLEDLKILSEIKWPNDIYVNKRKVCGILIEPTIRVEKIEYVVIGIGLNVNQKEFKTLNAVSIFNINGQNYDLEELLPLVLFHIKKKIKSLKMAELEMLKNSYYSKLYLKDKVSAFKAAGTTFMGIITGIDDFGKLLIEKESGNASFDLKEIEFLK